ncbi:MAG: hypothetical protein H6667_15275 [Ardenticatenaceae bacterium]|nr:hypothetical protein [Ardenticatenaceae bacterium]
MLTKKLTQIWIIPLALLLLMALLVWRAPVERSLGQGIKIVYVHVGLIWAGMLGFVVNGLLGLVTAVTNNKKLADWLHIIGLVSLVVFVVSVIVSLVAEQVNWGAVFWQEPRNTAVFSVTAVAIIVLVLNSWLPWRRVQGLLAAGLAVFAILTLPAAPMVMHPENPARTSSSMGIQYAFYGVFLLAVMISIWAVWYWRPKN